MNRNEFENGIKDKLQEQQFLPGEDMWLRLQADLQKTSSTKKAILFFTPVKMAAGILLAALGTLSVYLLNKDQGVTEQPAVAQHTMTTPQQQKVETAPLNRTETNIATTIVPGRTRNIKAPAIAVPQQRPGDNATSNNPVIASTSLPTTQNHNTPEKGSDKNNKQPEQPRSLYPEPNAPYYAKNDRQDESFHVGLIANVGSSTVSNVNYQVGVTGRTDLSNTFFVEAGLTLASNVVNSSNQYTFTGVSMGSDGFQNSIEKSSTNIKADYARNIISVGVTPAVGIKATKKLSFAAGAALNRNLNPSLSLSNGNEIESAALDNNIINTSQKVADWDLGLTCNAAYKVTKQLSFNVNYRQGLTDYLQQGNKQLKNSGVQLGLKYVFGK